MNAVLEAAMYWQHIGISPLPLKPRSKVPAISWKNLQFIYPTRQQVRRWFGRGCQHRNIGLLTGEISGNLVVADFDRPLPYHKWAALNPENAITHTVATRRGYHVYLRLAKMPATTLSMEGGAGEVKASGYVLAPPSTHPSGVLYKALNGPRVILRDSLAETGIVVCPEGEKRRSELPGRSGGKSTMPGGSIVDYIKSAYPIADYLEQFTSLHPSGGVFFMCCCPLHDDHNPSMWINVKHGTCRCFKPGCVGAEHILDVISLHSHIRGVSNTEAIYDLGSSLGA